MGKVKRFSDFNIVCGSYADGRLYPPSPAYYSIITSQATYQFNFSLYSPIVSLHFFMSVNNKYRQTATKKANL